MNDADSTALCLKCGLCCNGVIFADVQLEPEDDATRLRALGLPFANQNSKIKIQKFKQPCSAFAGCRCNIYAERPKYCREFECLLLKSVKAGDTSRTRAMRIIGTALERVKKVKELLCALGDRDEHLALSKRFQRTKRRLEGDELDDETAERFSELTLAVHDLNVLLSDAFYPGADP
jgi:Fe-S-cluster containining protein